MLRERHIIPRCIVGVGGGGGFGHEKHYAELGEFRGWGQQFTN